ncbi:hypothetical protein TSUD_339320 [Trifolium subterraneum]|nr:hypothetical protein TSUD_339320 [Trifolium subterraneum]
MPPFKIRSSSGSNTDISSSGGHNEDLNSPSSSSSGRILKIIEKLIQESKKNDAARVIKVVVAEKTKAVEKPKEDEVEKAKEYEVEKSKKEDFEIVVENSKEDYELENATENSDIIVEENVWRTSLGIIRIMGIILLPLLLMSLFYFLMMYVNLNEPLLHNSGNEHELTNNFGGGLNYEEEGYGNLLANSRNEHENANNVVETDFERVYGEAEEEGYGGEAEGEEAEREKEDERRGWGGGT